jgi:hypothetical protein
MFGTNQSKVTVTLRNPMDHSDLLEYYIIPNDTQLAKDWIIALKEILANGNLLEKNFCFIGFPKTARTLDFLCEELNQCIELINKFDFTQYGLDNYLIEEWFHPNTVRFPDSYLIEQLTSADHIPDRRINIGLQPKHLILNRLHNHFERLQGTVTDLSQYYKVADYETKYSIRQLNIICHELESLLLSQQKEKVQPEWVRPSQITTFLHTNRYHLNHIHKEGFTTNGYDRRFGHVYMHWSQIGKTLFEVWRDEGAPKLTDTVCEAITHLKYYSGEFDIEWGKDVTLESNYPWHIREQQEFQNWLLENRLNPTDNNLSLGYLPIGYVDILSSFGTTDIQQIHNQLSSHLDIYSIEVDGIKNTFNYCWTDEEYKQQQIDRMKPGYDFSSRQR